MADKFYKVLNKRSSEYANEQYKNGPKLPNAADLEYGELAVNYAKGTETISLKNNENEIVTIQNEVLVSATEVDTDTLKSTAKIIIDESVDGVDVEIYTKSEVDSNFATKDYVDSKTGEGVDITEKLKDYYNKSQTYSKNEVDAAIQGVDVSSQLVNYPDSAEYVPASKEIQFKHNGTLLPNMTIDADAFIKDGMVESVDIVGEDLVIKWNSDSNKAEDTKIALSKIFNANNYYDKNTVDNLLTPLAKQVTIGNETNSEQGYILIEETSDNQGVEVYTKAEVDNLLKSIPKIVNLTKNVYDQLTTKDPNTYYFIVEE